MNEEIVRRMAVALLHADNAFIHEPGDVDLPREFYATPVEMITAMLEADPELAEAIERGLANG